MSRGHVLGIAATAAFVVFNILLWTFYLQGDAEMVEFVLVAMMLMGAALFVASALMKKAAE